MAALRADALEEASRPRHVVARVWPLVKEKTGLTHQRVYDRYRVICEEFGIPPLLQPGTIGQWLRGRQQPNLEHGLAVLAVFNEALVEAGEEVIDPLSVGRDGGSPGNRTLNLRICHPLP